MSIPVGAFITLICLFIIMLAGAMGSAVVSIMALLVIFLVSDKVKIRNKQTHEIEEVMIGEFFDRIKHANT